MHGGESFYFTAPAKNSPGDMPLTNVTGSGCERFTALAIKTGTDSAQQQGSWTWDPDNTKLYTQIDWMDFGELELVKTCLLYTSNLFTSFGIYDFHWNTIKIIAISICLTEN